LAKAGEKKRGASVVWPKVVARGLSFVFWTLLLAGAVWFWRERGRFFVGNFAGKTAQAELDTPASTSFRSDEQIKEFVRAFMAASALEKVSDLSRFYASEVDYEEGLLSREELNQRIENRLARVTPWQEIQRKVKIDKATWPKRSLEIHNDEIFIEREDVDPGTVRVKVPIVEEKLNPRSGKTKRLIYWNRLVLEMKGRDLEITSHLRILPEAIR
jgi:hypothetical protein